MSVFDLCAQAAVQNIDAINVVIINLFIGVPISIVLLKNAVIKFYALERCTLPNGYTVSGVT